MIRSQGWDHNSVLNACTYLCNLLKTDWLLVAAATIWRTWDWWLVESVWYLLQWLHCFRQGWVRIWELKKLFRWQCVPFDMHFDTWWCEWSLDRQTVWELFISFSNECLRLYNFDNFNPTHTLVNAIYIFHSVPVSNHLCSISVDSVSAQWKRLPIGNEPPAARAYHSLTSIGSHYLLYGGFDGKTTFGDLWWLVPEGRFTFSYNFLWTMSCITWNCLAIVHVIS